MYGSTKSDAEKSNYDDYGRDNITETYVVRKNYTPLLGIEVLDLLGVGLAGCAVPLPVIWYTYVRNLA